MSPKAIEFALSQSLMGFVPEVLALKVSQRSRIVCWENVQRKGVLTQKHPLGWEGYLCYSFKSCEVESGFFPRLKCLQVLFCLATTSLSSCRLV